MNDLDEPNRLHSAHVPIRRGNLAGVPKVHFHDLRHTGNTLAASTGASLRELMDRMGHSSTRAAIIYQHATDERRHQVAKQLDSLARGQLKSGSGTQRARKSAKAD
ncbi:UNVERIFIED_ORG: integrase [Microbispora rosea subsp. rosea]